MNKRIAGMYGDVAAETLVGEALDALCDRLFLVSLGDLQSVSRRLPEASVTHLFA